MAAILTKGQHRIEAIVEPFYFAQRYACHNICAREFHHVRVGFHHGLLNNFLDSKILHIYNIYKNTTVNSIRDEHARKQ